MKRQLRSELLKLRTTRTTMGMAAAMLGIVVVAIALHSFGLPAERITSPADQLGVFIGVGGNLGSLFAALFGAMAITGDRKSTRLNSSHSDRSRMPSSA